MMADANAYCFTQIQTAVKFLETFGGGNIGMKQEEFIERLKEEAGKKGVPFDPSTFILKSAAAHVQTGTS